MYSYTILKSHSSHCWSRGSCSHPSADYCHHYHHHCGVQVSCGSTCTCTEMPWLTWWIISRKNHSKKAEYKPKPPGDVKMKDFTDDNQAATLVQSTSKSFMHSEEDLATFEPSEHVQTSGAMEHQGECTVVSLSLAPCSHVTGTCVLASFSDGSSEVSSSGSLFCSCT